MRASNHTCFTLKGRGWRDLLIVIAIASLTLSLATRFWTPINSPVHTAKSLDHRSLAPKRQHLNLDAVRWVTPIASTSLFKPVTLYRRIAPPEPEIPDHLFADVLYNRPPPPAESLL
jgi:hypothetical protein